MRTFADVDVRSGPTALGHPTRVVPAGSLVLCIAVVVDQEGMQWTLVTAGAAIAWAFAPTMKLSFMTRQERARLLSRALSDQLEAQS